VPKRKPISYTAQFVPGVFRTSAEVASELETLDAEPVTLAAVTVPPEAATHEHDPETEHELANERLNGRTVERSNGRQQPRAATVRVNTRHSFDVWQDQLQALTDIQAQRFSTTGKKPKMGDLIKEALDAYVAAHQQGRRERLTVRTNGRTGEPCEAGREPG
jgi:hypothetical protein